MLDKLDRGQDVHAVDAALKRHEAISTEVNAGVSGCSACVVDGCHCSMVEVKVGGCKGRCVGWYWV